MDDHGSGTSTRTDVAIAPQAWSETPIGLIKKDSTKGQGERGKRVSESLRVQDQTEPQVEPALMWNPRTTSERKNCLCIRRNFGAAQEQACESCRMVRGGGHHGYQHANATEFFGSDSRNLLK